MEFAISHKCKLDIIPKLCKILKPAQKVNQMCLFNFLNATSIDISTESESLMN